MGKKQHPLVRKLWPQIVKLISPIPENDFEQLLDVLKNWVNSHPILIKKLNPNYEHSALSLLLAGKINQFNFVQPEAGANLKRLISLDFCPPLQIEDILRILEIVVREFALFTKWETCPICEEGFLEYWQDMNTNEIILSCNECFYDEYLHKEKVDNSNLQKSIVIPASKQDIKQIH
ncbi:MAG TPA: hypothetical protein VK184_20895 [Nostocaceae cyanobacterium]|nr:hypothetical protein [Nostocaceae cyanobacterium]